MGKEESSSLFRRTGGNQKAEIVRNLGSLSLEESVSMLKKNGGSLKKSLLDICSGEDAP
ncbi:MAG: hypothetical protein OXF23_00305 [Candidatus Dadabacteria bacterium]|nr:hypothetical protein [Candidatus Dadabacteria bacterium]